MAVDVNEIMFKLISSKEQTYSDKQLQEIRQAIESEIETNKKNTIKVTELKDTYSRGCM